LAWGKGYAEAHFDEGHVWWLARMNDFVSGMTDDYATKLSGDIGGHSFFNR
jgi:dGTP triphosphohydrolase